MRRLSLLSTAVVLSGVSRAGLLPSRPLPAQRSFAHTAVLLKDVRKNDRGESRRLSFEERAERRSGKNKENRANKQLLIEEAETLVNEDFPAELQDIFVGVSEKCVMSAMKVLNMAKCLELLEVDMSPAGRGPPAAGHKLLLTKIAQVVKVSPTTIEIVPNSNSFSTPILQRVNRFDGTLQVSKENNIIKVVMQPVTTAQRDKAVEDIKHQISFFKNKVKQSRNNAGRVLQECGLEEQALAELTQGLDATMRSFVDENCIELESLAENVMTMGLDESDNAV